MAPHVGPLSSPLTPARTQLCALLYCIFFILTTTPMTSISMQHLYNEFGIQSVKDYSERERDKGYK